jgi:hypothetical protein
MAFRRVEGSRAGTAALGILMPTGPRTLVILRPRALNWDLVPIRPDNNDGPRAVFWEVSRQEGARLAEELFARLQEWVDGGLGRVEPAPAPGGVGYHVRIGVGRFVLITCNRVPGAPYQPAVFENVSKALAASERITSILCPTKDADQEIYFNTDQFR